jgi:hypothetical protein
MSVVNELHNIMLFLESIFLVASYTGLAAVSIVALGVELLKRAK